MTDRHSRHPEDHDGHRHVELMQSMHLIVDLLRNTRKDIATMSQTLDQAIAAAEARLADLKTSVSTDVAEIKDLLAKIAAGSGDQSALIARVDALTSGIGDAVASLNAVAPAV